MVVFWFMSTWTLLFFLTVLGTLFATPVACSRHLAEGNGVGGTRGRMLLGEITEWDSDGDGLSDEDEKRYGTDPHKADTDGDGLNDWEEINVYRTDPLSADSDGDGLNDFDELFRYQTNPMLTDSDSDGVRDADEESVRRAAAAGGGVDVI